MAVDSLVGVVCPLTGWEQALRRRAGQAVEEDISFVARLVREAMNNEFPEWVFAAVYVAFALMVIATFVLVPPRWRRPPAD